MRKKVKSFESQYIMQITNLSQYAIWFRDSNIVSWNMQRLEACTYER